VYDRDGVTTADWASYPILTFPEVPALEFELIQRLDQPPSASARPPPRRARGAGEACSTRRECGFARCRSERIG